MTDYDLLNQEECLAGINVARAQLQSKTKRISDLTIEEFKDLMVECFKMFKQDEVFVRNGIPISKEY